MGMKILSTETVVETHYIVDTDEGIFISDEFGEWTEVIRGHKIPADNPRMLEELFKDFNKKKTSFEDNQRNE